MKSRSITRDYELVSLILVAWCYGLDLIYEIRVLCYKFSLNVYAQVTLMMLHPIDLLVFYHPDLWASSFSFRFIFFPGFDCSHDFVS
jgi:hypothetical protein